MNKQKLILPISIILGCIILGGFYYVTQVSQQKSIERQQEVKIQEERRQQEVKRQEQEAKELKEQEAKEEIKWALDNCISDAEKNYHRLWHNECKALGKLTSKCIDIVELSYNEWVKKYGQVDADKYYDIKEFGNSRVIKSKHNEDCACRLPTIIADRYGKILETDKEECFKRYP